MSRRRSPREDDSPIGGRPRRGGRTVHNVIPIRGDQAPFETDVWRLATSPAPCAPTGWPSKGRISPTTRASVLARDGLLCQICQQPCLRPGTKDPRTSAPKTHPRSATLDHVIPRAVGGCNHAHNLRVACYSCNTTRGHAPGERTTVTVAVTVTTTKVREFTMPGFEVLRGRTPQVVDPRRMRPDDVTPVQTGTDNGAAW